MYKRIIVFLFVIIFMFVQYAGVSAQCLTHGESETIQVYDLLLVTGMKASFVPNSSPVLKETDEIQQETFMRYSSEERTSILKIIPWPTVKYPKQQGPFPVLKAIPACIPSQLQHNERGPENPAFEDTIPSQTPSDSQGHKDLSDSSGDAETGTGTETKTKTETDTATEAKSETDPGTGAEARSETEANTESDSVEIQKTDISPLVFDFPELDISSEDYIKFANDIKAMVEKAAKVSGIKTTYGIFVMDLDRKLYYGVNETLTRMDEVDNVPEGWFNSASVIKLFQGYIFCHLLRTGELDENRTYFDSVTGRKFKILPMLKSMISYSDNNYSNACLRLVDNRKSNEVLQNLGITNSRLYGEMSGAIGYSRQNNIEKYGTDKRCARITPQDTGLILYNIYLNKDTDKYMQTLNEGLLGNIYNSRIPVGVKRVSPAYKVAHKTGTNSSIGVYNDAGIVYAPTPFILVAFTQGTSITRGESFIISLAEQLTRYFSFQTANK